ncbi:Hypothetical predicted protein [Mytilus galloprovincialis]|uniref:Uncharacterized protein n=1 Tax=Mytilus galloprovincialis TaxID=29158 RepID=A0A8B6D9E9_MYTGA|nr:Hypothetical predicted protein [Mytilus galloprovincialis]
MESWIKAQFEESSQDLKNEIREQHIATVTDLKMFVERKLTKQKEAEEREHKEEEISENEEPELQGQFAPASSIPEFESIASGSGLQKRKGMSDLPTTASKVPKRKSSQGERQQTTDKDEIQPSVSDVLTAASKVLKRKSSQGERQPSVCFNKEQTKFVGSFAALLNWTVNETALKTMMSKGVQRGVFKEEEFTLSQLRDKEANEAFPVRWFTDIDL